MSGHLLTTIVTGLIFIFLIIGSYAIIAEPADHEKTELEVLSRQMRGVGLLLMSIVSIMMCKQCFA